MRLCQPLRYYDVLTAGANGIPKALYLSDSFVNALGI